jgi:hypothetical protein
MSASILHQLRHLFWEGNAAPANSPIRAEPATIGDVLAAVRLLDVQRALRLAATLRHANPSDATATFLEGVLAYAVRADEIALARFRQSMALVPLFVEAPVYVAFLLEEDAISRYRERFPGAHYTLESALQWADSYDALVQAVVLAKRIGEPLCSKPILESCNYYQLHLGIAPFQAYGSADAVSLTEHEFTKLENLLSSIGFPHDKVTIETIEAAADTVERLSSSGNVLFVLGHSPAFQQVLCQFLKYERPHIRMLEIGGTMSDEQIRHCIAAAGAGSVIIAYSGRPGCGAFFPWLPSQSKRVDIFFLDADYALSVHCIGLLARLYSSKSAPDLHFVLGTLVGRAHKAAGRS